MRDHVTIACKRFPTNVTVASHRSGMGGHMSCQVTRRYKTFIAHRTNLVADTCVDLAVCLEIAECRKLLRAHCISKSKRLFRIEYCFGRRSDIPSHCNGFSPLCVRICTSRLCFWANRRVHVLYGQEYGFSPVCVRTWMVNWAAHLNVLLHW